MSNNKEKSEFVLLKKKTWLFENTLAMLLLDIFDQVNSWFKIKSPIISTSSFPITMSLENEVDLN